MNRLSFTGIVGTGLWSACAIKVLGYIWESYSKSYDPSAFQIGGKGTPVSDIPVIPPLKRKDKPGQPGKKTRFPRLAPIPNIPPATSPKPSPGAPPWDSLPDILNPGKWGDILSGLLDSIPGFG